MWFNFILSKDLLLKLNNFFVIELGISKLDSHFEQMQINLFNKYFKRYFI